MSLLADFSTYNNHQSPSCQHVTASVALLELGKCLFQQNKPDAAMCMFDAASRQLRSRNPLADVAGVAKQLNWGQEQLQQSQKPFSVYTPSATGDKEDIKLFSCAPDLYQEDECDVGPRPFDQPMLPSSDLSLESLEAFVLYNKGLVYHSQLEFAQALRFYQATVYILSASMRTPAGQEEMLHPELIELGMRVNNNMGQIAYMEATSEETSMAFFEAAIVFAKQITEGPDALCLDIATVLSNWCRVNWMSGNLNENVYKGLVEVLRIRSAALPWNHVDVASAHFNLGCAYYAKGSHQDASAHLLHYLQVAAQKENQQDGSNNVDTTVHTTVKLDPIPALVYILLIKNEKEHQDTLAQELVRGLRSLQEKRNDLGAENPEVASVLNFVGTLLFHQRDFEHALLFFQEELRLEEVLNVAARGDVSVSVTCNNIGRILQELERLPEAVVYYNRALEADYGDWIEKMPQTNSGKSSKTAAAAASPFPVQVPVDKLDLPLSQKNLYSTVWYNLGLIHDKLGSYQLAIRAFQTSLGLRRVMLGPTHPDVACLLYNIGVLQMEQQMLVDATASFREVLRIRRVAATGQLNDCHVVKTLQKLASLHKTKGNIGGALEACEEVLRIKRFSEDFDAASRNKEVGATLREISELYHAQGDLDMAVNKAQESVVLLKQLPAGFVADVAYVEELAAALLLLGSLNHELCEPMTAHALFNEASEMIQQASSNFIIPTALDSLHEVTQLLATCHCAPEA